MWQRNTAAFAAKPFWEKEKRFLLRTNVMLTAKLDGLALFALCLIGCNQIQYHLIAVSPKSGTAMLVFVGYSS